MRMKITLERLLFSAILTSTAIACEKDTAGYCIAQFEGCKYECGEGILSGICKQVCTGDYHDCQSKAERKQKSEQALRAKHLEQKQQECASEYYGSCLPKCPEKFLSFLCRNSCESEYNDCKQSAQYD